MILFVGIIMIFVFTSIGFKIDVTRVTTLNTGIMFVSCLLAFASPITAIALCVGINSPTKTVTTYGATQHIKIAALNLGGAASGSFFLGSGEVNQHPEYYYMEETPKGYQLQSTDADQSTYIKEIQSGDTPHLDITDVHEKTEFTEPEVAFWFDPSTIFVQSMTDNLLQDGQMYTFYVPKGSVDQNYKVDLQNIGN